MAAKRINVLVYSGAGTSLNSVRRAVWSLRRLLGANYAVLTVTSDQILHEPWTSSCALLVMPGGADVNYCRILNGTGNRRIRQYVYAGGRYLGFCAGGYYGTSRCEFEVGRRDMEVIGDRELSFFPGICRGLAFPGFRYASEAGARACKQAVNRNAFSGPLPSKFVSYYNGGGVFVDAADHKESGVEVLASYDDDLAVDSGNGKAAVVYCKVGSGAAILTGPHPEFAGEDLDRDEPTNPHYGELVDALLSQDQDRVAFLRASLSKLGLDLDQIADSMPPLSPLHLSSMQFGEVTDIWTTLKQAGLITEGDKTARLDGGENIFHVGVTDGRVLDGLSAATKDLSIDTDDSAAASASQAGKIGPEKHAKPQRAVAADYTRPDLDLVLHQHSIPDSKMLVHFDHPRFFANLQDRHRNRPGLNGDYGRTLLYGDVVTSTNTLLEKNANLLSHLPIGTTAIATTQVAGRGRGTNVWVNPPGSLLFSVVLKHSFSLSSTAPVVFVQYLAAMAIVAGVKNYDPGNHKYGDFPIRLKWPNDIYAQDPTTGGEAGYVKVGGILVNSTYSGADYTLIVGMGLNVNNAAPTTSLSLLAQKLGLPAFSLEPLLASILIEFETLYARFCVAGFSTSFETSYYRDWLHTDQIVTLETEGGARARIKGITTDWGLLVAEEVNGEDRGTGRTFALQSDSNSFDFFKGLLKRKL